MKKNTLSIIVTFFVCFFLVIPPSNAQNNETVTVPVDADTFIKRLAPDQNFGSAEILEIDRFEEDLSQDHRVAFMRFNLNRPELAGKKIVSAKLLFSTNNTHTKIKSIRVVKDTGWNETQFKYKDYVVPEAPLMIQSLRFPVIAEFIPTTREQNVDVTDGIQNLIGNPVVFAIENDTAGTMGIYSKENKSGKPAPSLQLQVAPLPVSAAIAKSYSCPLVATEQKSIQATQNPIRGLYRWSNTFVNPNGTDIYDAYARYTWDQIETSEGTYDFSAIERDIAAFFGSGKNSGKKYAFRVRAMKSNGNSLPSFMQKAPYIQSCLYQGAQENVANWDDPAFIAKTQQLVDAIAKKYDGDNRIAWIDMGAYGRWGEWHMSAYDSCKASTDTQKKYIDMYLNAFKTTTLQISGTEQDMAAYALAQTRTNPSKLNIRKDCVGFSSLYCSYSVHLSYDLWNETKDRWKYAPYTSEFGNPASLKNPESFYYGQSEATAMHISLLGNGNIFPWSEISPEGQAAFTKLDQLLGYSYVLNDVSMSGALNPGNTLNVITTWSNYGSTPTYEPWIVTFLLKNSAGQIVYQQPLTVNLKTVLPTYNRILEKNEPVIKNDTVTLPANLAVGEYTPFITVTDARTLPATDPDFNNPVKNNPRKPMTLAGNTKQDTGYPLCSMKIQANGEPTIIQTQPPVPSSTPGVSPTTIDSDCPKKPLGDANCDGKINLTDLEIWTREFIGEADTVFANFDGSKQLKPVTLQDLQIWQDSYLK